MRGKKKVVWLPKHRYFDECGLYDVERQRREMGGLLVAEKQKKTVDGEPIK